MEIVKNICVFTILTTVLNNLLQDNVYRKYIRMYVGLVMIILVIKPVLSVFSMDIDFEQDIDKYMAGASLQDTYSELVAGNTSVYDEVLEEYERVLNKTMDNLVTKYGLCVMDIEWYIEENIAGEFGKINGIRLSLAYADEVTYIVKDDLYRDIEYEFEIERENVSIEII